MRIDVYKRQGLQIVGTGSGDGTAGEKGFWALDMIRSCLLYTSAHFRQIFTGHTV